jgi:hypothetical protein
MKMRNLAIMLAPVLMLGLLRGQDKPAVPETPTAGFESAIIHVKTLDGDSFSRLVNLLRVFDAKIQGDDHLRTILVYGRPDVVAQMRHVVEELDRPGSEAALGHNMEMTLTFLRCSTKPPSTPAALPADLEGVARQLRAVTQYRDIALWDVLPLHLQEGKRTEETFGLPSTDGSHRPYASVQIQPDGVYRKEQARFVRFRTMRVNIRIPVYSGTASAGQWTYTDVSLDTAGDFAEGQKTVLGKLSGLDDESAIFIVVTLKVLD